MLRGLYTSASGMNAELLRQDVVANNIANANTTGFKKD
ncbi:MAG TPA: flagellar basal body protein, partial [bacterium]|nr:flagellar basal body protein [bacterium]